MMQSLWATVHDGKIELAEQAELPEGAKLLVTVLTDDVAQFWSAASQPSIDAVWGNAEDDAYAQLLEE